jgi:hypothetical protein
VFILNQARTEVDGYFVSECAFLTCLPTLVRGRKKKRPAKVEQLPTRHAEEKSQSVRTVSGGLPGLGKRR